MQTIQEIIRNTNPKSIEDAYFVEHPVKLHEIAKHDNVSIGEFKKLVSDKFQAFLRRLCNMEITPGKSILFVYKSQTEAPLLGKDVGLIHSDELLDQDDISKVPTYAYEFTEQKEALGFLVADNKLTQDNIMDVIVCFLHAITFFGFDQEHLDKEKRRLENSIKEMNEHPERLRTFDPEEFENDLGLPKEEEYPEEAEKRSAFYKAGSEYTIYCRNIELMRIKEQLKCLK